MKTKYTINAMSVTVADKLAETLNELAALRADNARLRGALAALVNGEITLSNKSSALYMRGDSKGFLSEHCQKVIAARAALAGALEAMDFKQFATDNVRTTARAALAEGGAK